MATKNKTTATTQSAKDFVSKIESDSKRNESLQLIDIFKELSGFDPVMWGPSIIGFGSYHYKYESGREGDAPLTGFSPRKDAFAIYLATDFNKKEELLQQLGKHKTGAGCLYIKKLEDIKLPILKKLITNSIAHVKKLY
ncbi:MAG: DUF1801 domain-containing protein [Candidatus Pseudobacter hemicellulosilyticus]|uniref:DUF1801 domain-containing protein n=1 Tax=Candidatus Pseudobacter hemicellulosilyticus TaxID=3121375 RepID=A0AAJ6BJ87_9BACT|nr:MAG: DUF1801 domain-containing protein [Pseudobacter sp.]